MCGAQPSVRCGGWHWSRDSRTRWVPGRHLHVARGWRERSCRKCGAWPGCPCRTPSGRETARIHAARLHPGRGELFVHDDIWIELEQRGASIARVPFSGRAGRGGQTERIEFLCVERARLVQVESWTSPDELCFALEAPVWARFGTFVGQPQINGELLWLSAERVVEIVATRGGRRFEERVS